MRYIFAILLFCGIIFHIEGNFYSLTPKLLSNNTTTRSKSTSLFDATNINCTPPYNSRFEVAASETTLKFINELFERPFSWLSKGTQSYVFLSEDQDYVLKIFKQRQSKPWRHVEQIYIGSKVAFEEMCAESGIIFLHNIPIGKKLNPLIIYDDHGNMHQIESDQISFLIQKKAQYIKSTIVKLMKSGNEEQAKLRIDQIFNLLIETARRNIVDRDDHLISTNNIGFIEDRAIYIDTGRFIKTHITNVDVHIKQELQKRLSSLYAWLQRKYPRLGSYFIEKRKKVSASLEGEDVNTSSKPFLNELQSYQNVVR